MVAMTWTISTGCKILDHGRLRIVESNEVEVFLVAGQNFTVPTDGVFMPDARYRRYRRAVADEILRLESNP